jgi:HAD superfamily hydrolase (TIGR01459 family)
LTLENTQLSVLIDQFDAFLIDQYGVLLDGSVAYLGAAQALGEIADRRKPVVILSNSGKRSQYNCDRLVSHGFDRAHFKTALTSGEIAYEAIAGAIGKTIDRDARILILKREEDASPIADLGLRETNDPNHADVMLIVSRDISKSRADYRSILEQCHKKSCRCLCLNPDLKMLTPQGLTFSAGTIAHDYQNLGGTVEWYGKPHAGIYAAALEILSGISPMRILCIGDSIDHDIFGGQMAGLSTALVRQGVHAGLTDEEIEVKCKSMNIWPDHVLHSFSL